MALDKSKQLLLAIAPNLKTANQFLRFIALDFGMPTAHSYADTLRDFKYLA